MNRRDVIAGMFSFMKLGAVGAAGVIIGKSLPKTTASKCPCVDPDDNPQTPLQKNHIQICAFHINPKNKSVIETTHYCTSPGGDLFQCVLYENNKPNAKLLGVEYVISDKFYKNHVISDKFDPEVVAEEKKYWHPHHFEVSEGLLQTDCLPIAKRK